MMFFVIGGIATIFVLLSIALFCRRYKAVRRNEMYVLHYGMTFRAVGGLMVAFSVFVFIACLQSARKVDLIPLCLVLGGFFLGSLYLFLEFAFTEIKFDNVYLYMKSPWMRFKRIEWDSIVSHSFSMGGEYHILLTKEGDKIKLYKSLSGLESLAEELLKRGIITDRRKTA